MSSKIWNKAEALDCVGGDEELLQDLFKIFLEEFPKLIQKLQPAVADQNPDEVMRAAHGIKGEVSYLSAQHAVDLAQELEDMGHKKSLSGARDLVQVSNESLVLFRMLLEIHWEFSSDEFAPSY